jgi:hypothetical protein
MEYNCLAENPSQERVLSEIDNVPEEVERGIIVLSLNSQSLFGVGAERIKNYNPNEERKENEEKPVGLVFKIDGHFDWKNLKGVINEKIRDGYGIYSYEFLWKAKDDGKEKHHLLRYDAIEIRGKKSLEYSIF